MKRRFPFRQFHRYPPVYSLRVHWGPLLPSSHRLGAFASSPHPGVHGFPGRRLLCPIRLSMRALAFRWGLPSLLTHSPSHPSRSLPCSTWKTQPARDRWRVPLLAPSALCGSPVCGQRGEQVDLCHLCHRLRWTAVPTRSARICLLARLADSLDTVCQGQRSTEGLYHASGDAPYRSSAQPPPLAGVSPAHGAFQEHAAHILEWSMMLSSNGSLGACTVLDMISFTYMRSEADLIPFGPAQRVAIAAWTRRGVLAAAPADDRRPMPLGGSAGSGLSAGRQSG